MQGIPFEMTDQVRKTILKAAKKGLLLKDIVRAIGLKNLSHFHAVIKHQHPEIEELIEEGRAQLRDQMLEMSHNIITDPANFKDPARPQEINRLHRIAKTEEAESASIDPASLVTGGFEVVIKKKPDVGTT